MTESELLTQIKADLGANFYDGDEAILSSILSDVIEDSLLMSNRGKKAGASNSAKETQIGILASNIKKAVKTIYLQRGIEDVKSNSQSGLSNTYEDAMETMLKDIIRQNKRLFI